MSLNVLWLVKGLGHGGAERLIMGMAPRVDPSLIDLDIAYLLPWKDSLVPELEDAGIRVHCLMARRTVDPGWIRRLRALLHDRRYDVVHTHSPIPAAVARMVAPRSTRFVHTEHNVWSAYGAPTRYVNALTYGRNDAVWAVSDAVAATIAPPRWLPWRQPPVSTMLHGVEVEDVPRGKDARAAARRRLGLKAEVPAIVSVATLTAKKDPLTLLAAVDLVRRDVPDVECCLIGSGPLEADLRRDISSRGLEGHVHLLGTRDDVPQLLPAFDVFALSSRFEGLGLSLLEAMAAEVACVSTSVGGVPEVIEDRVNGRLVPVADRYALAAALTETLTDDGGRAEMVAAGRQRVRTEFANLDRVVRASEQLYADVAERSTVTDEILATASDADLTTRKLRVLWLTKGLGLGGAERLLTVMAPRFDPARFEIDVAYVLPWKDAFVSDLRDAGITVHCLGARHTLDPWWIRRLRKLLTIGRYDVVHTHAPVPAAAARILAPRNTRFLHTEHNVWDRYRWPTYVANLLTYHRSEHVFAVSDGVRDSVRSPRWWPRTLPPVATLLHGVDPREVPRGAQAREVARERLGIPTEAPAIVNVANLTPKKDQSTLLSAVDQLRHEFSDVIVCMIGSGPLEEELRDQIDALGLGEYVRMLGSRDDVPDLLPAFDVFALSSRFEGLPISLLEAMAAEVACVTTAVGGIPEAVDHRKEGLLVPAGDVTALADALSETLRDPVERARMVAAGRERVTRDFSIDRAVREMTRHYVAESRFSGSG